MSLLGTAVPFYVPGSSRRAASTNAASGGLKPGPPARCPQTDSMGRSSALGIIATSASLASGGKYKPRSLAGKPLAGFRATPSRPNPVLYGPSPSITTSVQFDRMTV